MDTLIIAISAVAGVFLQNCNLLEWIGLLIFLGLAKAGWLRVGGDWEKPWLDKPWYWRYLSVISVTPLACFLLFFFSGGFPAPAVSDEWSHLFLADTLLEGRFSNPPDPNPVFFETIHMLPSPTRSSMYFFGPALWLAAGKLLFGHPLWGIALAGAILGAALLWTLEAVLERKWAWLGTMLFLLKPVCGGIWGAYWIQSAWGGIPGALAGVLVTGGVWRLTTANPWVAGTVLGLGAALLMNTRPFEGLALCAGLAFTLRAPMRKLAIAAIPVILILAGTVVVMRLHFQAVTGDSGKTPYARNQELYGWPMTLPWMPVRELSSPHEDLRAYWEWERSEHETSLAVGAVRKAGANWQHYIGGFLAIPLLLALRRWRSVPATILIPLGMVVVALLIEQTGFPHYLSPAAAPLAALIAWGCQAWRGKSQGLALGLAAMFAIRLFVPQETSSTDAARSFCCRYNIGAPRQAVLDRLNSEPGEHLVFVPNTIHMGANEFYSWIHNPPDIAGTKVIFARDLGGEQNLTLSRAYPHRKLWTAGPGIPLKPLPAVSGSGLPPANRQP